MFVRGMCNAMYYDENCHQFKVRGGEHSGISLLTNKWSKSKTINSCQGPYANMGPTSFI